VPPRIWDPALTTFGTGNSPKRDRGDRGARQSVHLEHLMNASTGTGRSSRASASSSVRAHAIEGGACEHVAALAYAFAEEIDRDPSALLRWRGVDAIEEGPAEPEEAVAVETAPPEAWEAGTLPEPRQLRPLPLGAVLKRLGPSGLKVGWGRSRRRARAGLRRVREARAAGMTELEQEIDAVAAETGFSGAVRVDRGGQGRARQGVRPCSPWLSRSRTPSTRVSRPRAGRKGLTALAVVSLVDAGSLELSTTARSVLGEDLPLIADDVTIEHLLAHRSGIGDLPG
jgi:CubicO group peptidase (beta-lactamase class C family)